MTETSSEFAKLERALVEAGGLLADLPMHDVGDRLNQLKLKSHVLLCHAAIEEYLEKISLAVLWESLKAYEEDGMIRDPLLSACSYYKIVLSDENASRQNGELIHNILLSVFQKAIVKHSLALDTVHGIKTKDQQAILLPIGVNLFEFDRVLSQNLNLYGGIRGMYAHGFGFQTINPRAAQESTVWNLFRLLLELDNLLCSRYKMAYQTFLP